MYKLPRKFTKQLAKQPETGMGYQNVDITFNNGRKINATVVSCTYVDSQHIISMKEIKTIKVV